MGNIKGKECGVKEKDDEPSSNLTLSILHERIRTILIGNNIISAPKFTISPLFMIFSPSHLSRIREKKINKYLL